MARIAFDTRISRAWSTGIGVYTVRLIEALSEVAPEHRYVLLLNEQAPPPPLVTERPVELRRLPERAAGPGQHTSLPRRLRRLGIDVLVVMHPVCAPLSTPCPRLVFVHDVIPLVVRDEYGVTKRLYYRTLVRWSLCGATKVLVDSEHTRRDCERLLGLPSERLRVVYGGPGHDAALAHEPCEVPTDRPYLLYVGNKRPHKNVDVLIEAFASLVAEDDPGCDLLIAGREQAGDMEADGTRLRALTRRLGLDGRVRFLGEVAPHRLPALYRGAAAFVYLSRYEGLGLPPLEAMACGTPVVALNATSLPEVVGEGGLLLDDASPGAVARALRAVLRDERLRACLIERGRAQARRFTWERTARAVAEEIEAALGRCRDGDR